MGKARTAYFRCFSASSSLSTSALYISINASSLNVEIWPCCLKLRGVRLATPSVIRSYEDLRSASSSFASISKTSSDSPGFWPIFSLKLATIALPILIRLD